NARQLLSQTNNRGVLLGDSSQSENLVYTYDAAGQIVEMQDKSFDPDGTTPGKEKVTKFSYNAAGQHVLEQTTQDVDGNISGNPVYQDQMLAYDALGRLALVSGLDGVDVHFDYDLVGNRRHQSVKYNIESPTLVPDYGTEIIGYDDQGNPIEG